jgi:GDP-4-dehydro-6-deoxy-D-mannose reductase
VIHLAATLVGAPDLDDGLGGFGGTLRGTASLCEAVAADAPTARVVVLSSSAVYGQPVSLPVAEGAPVRPLTTYGVSKAAQELLALRWRWAGDLDFVVVRSFNLVGPGMPRHLVLGDVARQLATGRQQAVTVEVGNLTPRRDYLDVRDLATALAGITLLAEAPPILNVAAGKSWSVGEVVERMVELSGGTATVRQSEERRRYRDIIDQVGDTSLLADLTGWSPTFDLDRSLADLLAGAANAGEGCP